MPTPDGAPKPLATPPAPADLDDVDAALADFDAVQTEGGAPVVPAGTAAVPQVGPPQPGGAYPPAPDSATAFLRAHAAPATPCGAGGGPGALPGGYVYSPDGGAFGRRTALLLTLVVLGFVLWFGEPLLVPLALSVLLSFLLSPMCEWLERRHFPRPVAVVVVVTLAFVLLGALGWAVFNGVTQLADNHDRIRDNLVAKVKGLSAGGEGGSIQNIQESFEQVSETLEGADKATEAASGNPDAVLQQSPAPATAPAAEADQAATQPTRMEQLLLSIQQTLQAQSSRQSPAEADTAAVVARKAAEEATTRPVRGATKELPFFFTPVPPQLSPLERTGYLLGRAAGPVGTAGLVIVFTLFVLLQRDDLRDRLIKLTAGRQINLATQALDDAATRISKYLRAMAIVNGTYGLAVGIGLEAIAFSIKGEHFPSVWLWALLCATLRFIPYVGPWVAAAFPIFVSIGYYPDYTMFFATAGFFIIIELLSNNVMEPILYGSSTGMSPVAVIVAAAFWTFVWGPVGLLMATPLTTCLVVLGKYVPALRFFDILLGDEPVLKPHMRLYQRMLALDADDAADVTEEYREEHTLTETFDSVMMPTLVMAEHDRHAGRLTAERVDFVRVAMREIAHDLGTANKPTPADSVDLETPIPPDSPAQLARVLIIPSADAADETAAQMLGHLLTRRGFDTSIVDEGELTSEKLERVFAQHADVVVISAVPPRATARARYLVKRLQQGQSLRGEGAAGDTGAAAIVGLWTCKADLERATRRLRGDVPGTDVRVVATLADAVEAVRQRAQVVATRRAAEADARSKQAAPDAGSNASAR